ncbi:MAG: PfkB family carbohydrate kinase [Actinomycetota bacterium]
MRVAVVGHVEWVEFARVDRVPRPGEIIHAHETWWEPAGGGGVAAVQLARMAGGADFFTAVGDDELGHHTGDALAPFGVRVHAAFRDRHTRRAFTFLDPQGERTITTIGERLEANAADPLPWDELAGVDGVYFTAGGRGALEAARRARVVVATSRILPKLVRTRVQLDALVGSANDPGEAYQFGAMDPHPRLEVLTAGHDGGRYRTASGESGSYPAAPVLGPTADAYGAGDSFAAGLTFALASRMDVEQALAFASNKGAEAMTRRGAHGTPPASAAGSIVRGGEEEGR